VLQRLAEKKTPAMWAALGKERKGREGGREGGREKEQKRVYSFLSTNVHPSPFPVPPSLPPSQGDLTNDEGGCYERAWVLSKGRYARAKRSLGRRAFREVGREGRREGGTEFTLFGWYCISSKTFVGMEQGIEGEKGRAKTAHKFILLFLIQQGKWQETCVHLQAAVKVSPLVPEVWFILGMANMAQEEWKEALQVGREGRDRGR